MLEDLDATLKALLADGSAPADLRAADVSFDTPDKDFTPGQATVGLFLHDVAENRELRDNARVMGLSSGTYTIGPPPLRFDCSYLVTAWSAKNGALRAQEEHRLLGLGLIWVSRFSYLEDRFLQGALQTPPQPYPPPISVGQTKEGQTMGQFWTALGIAPRPAFSVVVTITAQPSDATEQVPPVQAIGVQGTSLDQPVLAGRVFDQALQAVPGARVTVVGTDRTAVTSLAGAFRFPGLAVGDHSLLVQITGRPDVPVTASFTARDQVHDVYLP